jgi:hypothetical protein
MLVTCRRDNPEDIVRMVFSMFDTCQVADYCQNPFAKEHGLNQVYISTPSVPLSRAQPSTVHLWGSAMSMMRRRSI